MYCIIKIVVKLIRYTLYACHVLYVTRSDRKCALVKVFESRKYIFGRFSRELCNCHRRHSVLHAPPPLSSAGPTWTAAVVRRHATETTVFAGRRRTYAYYKARDLGRRPPTSLGVRASPVAVDFSARGRTVRSTFSDCRDRV